MGLVAVYIDTVNTFDEAIRLNATVFILLILLFLHHPVNRNTALLKKTYTEFGFKAPEPLKV